MMLYDYNIFFKLHHSIQYFLNGHEVCFLYDMILYDKGGLLKVIPRLG